MEFQTDLPGWLNRYSCPAFFVKENIITAGNQAAQAQLLSPGMDIRELLLTGKAEYADFQGGCLYLKLNLSSKGCGASAKQGGVESQGGVIPQRWGWNAKGCGQIAKAFREWGQNAKGRAETRPDATN